MNSNSSQSLVEDTRVNLKPEDIQLAEDFAMENPHLFPYENTLPWMLRNRNRNGLSKSGAVLMINRKTYLVVPKFMKLLLSKTT